MRVEHHQLSCVTHEILLRAGVDTEQAHTVTQNLIWCDMVGRRNHGVERLPILLKHVAAGTIKCPCRPSLKSLAPTIERLDADHAFGHHAGRLAVDRACELARDQGIGIVGVLNSNFFGAGAYYSNLAAQAGMASLVLSNSFPKVAAPGGLRAALGTNPFTFGAPRREGRSLLVDMSTASVAGSTVRQKVAQGEVFPEGVAIDADGNPILDPNEVMKGTLLPAAGAKGFGLALMVEILSAVLTGAAVSDQVGSMYKDFEKSGRNGHFVLALDVSRWMPLSQFHDRLDALAGILSRSGHADSVRLPGETRWQHYEDSLEHGVTLDAELQQALETLAQKYQVQMPWNKAPSGD